MHLLIALIIYVFIVLLPAIVLFVLSRRFARALPDAASQIPRGRKAAIVGFSLGLAVHVSIFVVVPLVNGRYDFVGWLISSWAGHHAWALVVLAIGLCVYGKRKQDARALGAVRGIATFLFLSLVLAYPYAALLAALGVRGTYG